MLQFKVDWRCLLLYFTQELEYILYLRKSWPSKKVGQQIFGTPGYVLPVFSLPLVQLLNTRHPFLGHPTCLSVCRLVCSFAGVPKVLMPLRCGEEAAHRLHPSRDALGGLWPLLAAERHDWETLLPLPDKWSSYLLTRSHVFMANIVYSHMSREGDGWSSPLSRRRTPSSESSWNAPPQLIPHHQ